MDGRSRDVLLALIREYVRTAEPVGSRALAKRYFPTLSPATLRNVMADLEDMGYLAQPHTSAGRVPTDKAYRLYVEAVPPPVPTPVPAEGRPSPLDGRRRIHGAHLVAAVERRPSSPRSCLTPPLKQTTVGRVEVMPLEEDRALAVVVTESGWVTARSITVDPPRTADEIRNIGRELSRRFRGRTVQEIVDMEASPADPLDALHTRARAVTDQIVAMLQGRTLYVSGAINMLDQPEFWDLATTRDLLRMFEQKERLADLMTTFAGGEGLRVTIGEENPVAEMRECTMITSTYLYRNQVLGILGRGRAPAPSLPRDHRHRGGDGPSRHRRTVPRAPGALPAALGPGLARRLAGRQHAILHAYGRRSLRPPTSPPRPPPSPPRSEIEALRRQLADKQDRLLRALAEADNIRRRAQRDREDYVRYANESLLRDLVPVLDNLDRALAAARPAGERRRAARGRGADPARAAQGPGAGRRHPLLRAGRAVRSHPPRGRGPRGEPAGGAQHGRR